MCRKWSFLGVMILVLLQGCARSPIKTSDQALRVAKKASALQDDLNFAGFAQALQVNIDALKKTNQDTLIFGPYTIAKKDYLEALEKLKADIAADVKAASEAAKANSTKQEKDKSAQSSVQYNLALKNLADNFVQLEVYGGDSWGEIFMTSYFEPIIRGSLKKTKQFTQPLYALPDDMVFVKVYDFAERFPQLLARPEQKSNQKFREGIRGRVVKMPSPSLAQVVPYYSRGDIDSKTRPLDKTTQIIAWVDPVDAFFLHIQGSGRVQIEAQTDEKTNVKTKAKIRNASRSELRVVYAGQNGHEYMAIGQFLFDIIPREKMSLQKIEAHLRALPQEQMQELMNKNPSYIFFATSDKKAVTYFGNEAQAGRTIATDQKYFPKGALALLQFDHPVFASPTAEEPSGFKKVSRLVFDQDTGGAIKGPGRVDLFWGSGPEAKQHSGVIKNHGRLSYLLPKAFVSR